MSVTVDPETQPYDNWQNYRAYLSDYESYYGVNYPFCFLSDVLSFEDLTLEAVVPKNAVPDGGTYALVVYEFNQTWQPDREAGLAYSNKFSVTGSDLQAYSKEEWAGPNQVFNDLPCSALDCSRKCKEKTFATKTAAFWTISDYCACLAKCPGVVTEGAYEGNHADGCGSEWERMKTGSAVFMTTATQSTQIGDVVSATAGSPSTTDSSTQVRSITTTLPAPTATATINPDRPSSIGAAMRLIPSAIAAVAIIGILG